MSLKIIKEVETLVTPFLNEKGFRIYDTVFVKEGKDKVLRLFVDRKDGLISIDECEEVSRFLSDELDRVDLIKEAYILEVSSPGIERNLKYDWHFEESVGKKVQVKLFKKVKDTKLLVGTLVSGSLDTGIVIDVDTKEVEIEKGNIIDVKIYFEFGGN
ncbi:MAG: ribosome maturation factor RimP [Ruminococcaceae bacterium]|nr:ribosome maturation factor RimP [Oscillospiraceae bacterium]